MKESASNPVVEGSVLSSEASRNSSEVGLLALILILFTLLSGCSPQHPSSPSPTQTPADIQIPTHQNPTFTPSAAVIRSVTPSTPTVITKVIPDEFKTSVVSYDAYSTDALVVPNQPEGQPIAPFEVSWRDNDTVSASFVWRYIELGMAKGALDVNTPNKYSWTDRSELSKPIPLNFSNNGSAGSLESFTAAVKPDILLKPDLSVLISLTVLGKDGGEVTRSILITPFDYNTATHEIFPVPGNLKGITFGYSDHKIVYSGPLVKYLERNYARNLPFGIKFVKVDNPATYEVLPWGIILEQVSKGNLFLPKDGKYEIQPCLIFDTGKRWSAVIYAPRIISNVLDYKLKP